MYVDSACERKKQLRREFRGIRSGMPSAERAASDGEICERVVSSGVFRDCALLLSYVSFGGETDTEGIITAALSAGKTVAVPRCDDKSGNMRFYIIDSLDILLPGEFSIPEPPPEKCRPAENFDGAVCIVPALAYDKDGYRLGYGKGYYDRFLSAHPEVFSIGIEYDCCTVQSLVRDEYDIPADMLVTEKYIIETKADWRRKIER